MGELKSEQKSRQEIQNEINAPREVQTQSMEIIDPMAREQMIVDNGNSILNEFRRESYNPLLREGINMMRALFRSSGSGENGEEESLYSKLNKDDNKRSASFRQLRDSMAELEGLLSQYPPEADIPAEKVTDVLLRLSECANAYYDTHRGHRYSSSGQEAKRLVNEVRRLISGCMEAVSQGQGDVSYLNEDSDIDWFEFDENSEEALNADDNVKRLDKVYAGWAKNLGTQEGRERKRIRDKVALFKPYERYILIYQHHHPRKSEWPYCVQQYELYKREFSILQNLEQTEKAKKISSADDVANIVRDHAMEMDEQEEEKKLSAERVDNDLREDQIRGVEEIDRYLIRNFQNGGLMGSIAYSMKNNHADIISELFRKTKRERLFIYYLIETGERKKPTIASVYNSQGSYTPDLKNFKDKMLASKLKLTTRFTGGYIYMHKLSEAMGVNKDYKEVVKDCCLVAEENEVKDQEEINRNIPEDQRQVNAAYETRKSLLKKTFRSVNALHEAQLAYQKAEKENSPDKEDLRQKVEELSRVSQKNMQDLTKADDNVELALNQYKIARYGEKNETRKNSNGEDFVANAGYYAKGLKVAAENSDMIINKSLDMVDKVFTFFGGEPITGWRLKDTGLGQAKLWSSAVTGPAVTGIAQLISTINAVYNLCSNGAKMHAGDIGENVVSIFKGLGDMAVTAWGAVEKGKHFVKYTGDLAQTIQHVPSSALTVAGTVTSSVAIALNGYKIFSSGLDYQNANNAQEYLNKKHNAKALTKEEMANLSEEERARELKRQKEVRYEKCMIKLGQDLARRNMTAGAISAAASTASLVSVLVPGVGLVTAIAGGVISIISSVVAAKMTSIARVHLFDAYFNLDGLYEKVEHKMKEKGRRIYDKEKFRENLRLELCGSAGYADMGAAADHIAAKFADYVREKLFSDDFTDPGEREAYVQMVKSFGMTVNKEKDQPDRETLKRKMSGR